MKQSFFLILVLIYGCFKFYGQCNGMATLCNKKYDEVAYLTTHNAFNSDEDNFLYPNQNLNITSQLNDGVRALMIDVYDVAGTPTVYHGSSFLGSAPFSSFLIDIKTFLDTNPNEIVTIILECYTTANQIEIDINFSGLSNYLYTHTSPNWPTLQNMIDNGTRLVVFSDMNDANPTQEWYHYIWNHAVETHFTTNSLSDFNCNFNRGDSSNDLFILNHFVTDSNLGIGLESEAITANTNPFFINRVIQCYEEKAKFPNFITIDFYDKGDGFQVVNQLNMLSALNIDEHYYSKLSLWPNPSSNFVHVSGLKKNIEYKIYNTLNIQINEGIISDNERIDIQKLASGIYFLKFEKGNTLKFIKE
jgi:hypothetical protein